MDDAALLGDPISPLLEEEVLLIALPVLESLIVPVDLSTILVLELEVLLLTSEEPLDVLALLA